ncbi:hypothetical protein QE411_000586 [Microbacterium arborescens]|nr:hypothetical protein [Microbacterium arborescens]
MAEQPMPTTCMRCGLDQPMTIAQAMSHDDECRKAQKGR